MKANRKFRIIFALMIMVAVTAAGAAVYAAEYHVSSDIGSDSNLGTADMPFRTIQKAADSVVAGDTVIIEDGTYYETVTLRTSGTKDKPIVFKAANHGKNKVIISGAREDIKNKSIKWTLEDSELGLYSIPFDYQVYRMTADGTQVVEYMTLNGLKTYTANEANNMVGYKQGYYYDSENSKMYIRLREDEKYCSSDPNEAQICVPRVGVLDSIKIDGRTITGQNGSVIGNESYLFGITTENSANVFINGITFEMPAVAAVWARCDDVTVSNCWFIGCREGVRGGARGHDDPYVSKNITIEYCDYTDFPIYTDGIEMMIECQDDESRRMPDGVYNALYYWHSKNGTTCNYEGGGLAVRIGENWTLRNNYFHDLLDAISSYCNFSYWYSEDGKLRQVPAKNITVYGNKFENCFDNAIEFEDNTNGWEVSYNEFCGMMDPISWQPLAAFPFPTNINFHHNIIWNTPEEGWVWWYTQNYMNGEKVPSPRYSGLFKFGASADQWSSFPWMHSYPIDPQTGNPVDSVKLEDDGMRVWNNTFIYPNMAFEENVGLLGGGNDNISNIEFYNNIIQVVVCAEDGTFKGGFKKGQAFTEARGIYFDHNMLISGLDVARDPGTATDEAPSEVYVHEPIVKNGGFYVNDIDKVGFVDWENANFELTESSIARDAGIQLDWSEESTTDMGAVPYGSEWSVVCGPHAIGDVNADGSITIADIAETGVKVGTEIDVYTCRADLDRNSVIDETDLELVMKEYVRSENR